MPDRFNDWYDYLNPVKYGEAGWDAIYGDPANAQKTAYGMAGNSASALGREQRDWYGDQGKTALGFFGGGNGGIPSAGGMASSVPPSRLGASMTSPNAFRDMARGGGAPAAGGFPSSARAGGGVDLAGMRAGMPKGPVQLSSITPDDALNRLAGGQPTQQRDFYEYMQGQAGNKTNLENLYAQRQAGGDPAAAFEDSRAERALNNRFAATGGFNSGAGIRATGDYYANVGAQRSRDMAGLAGAADSSRLGLDNAYGGSAKGASGEQRDYYSDLFGASMGLGKAKADTFTHFADKGGEAYSQGELAKIEAQLAAAGVDAATIKQFMSDLGKGVEAGTKIAAL